VHNLLERPPIPPADVLFRIADRNRADGAEERRIAEEGGEFLVGLVLAAARQPC
jgi:hypothetical protein